MLTALRDQLDELDGLVAPLDEDGWSRPSACPGWTISDVLIHLAQTNDLATASVRGDLAEVAPHWTARQGQTVDEVAADGVSDQRGAPGREVHERWRRSAAEMVGAFAGTRGDQRVLWVSGDMAARSLATTRLAETWIHTEDVAEGLGVDLPGTDGLWHVARLVHRTIPYAFERAGERPPGAVRFELTAPDDGDVWVFGDDDAPTTVTGPALDLCRVAGQRSTAEVTDLTGDGPDADRVLALVRTFA